MFLSCVLATLHLSHHTLALLSSSVIVTLLSLIYFLCYIFWVLHNCQFWFTDECPVPLSPNLKPYIENLPLCVFCYVCFWGHIYWIIWWTIVFCWLSLPTKIFTVENLNCVLSYCLQSLKLPTWVLLFVCLLPLLPPYPLPKFHWVVC